MKKIGFDGPLYIMPFDHRYPYAAEVFGFAESMSPEQITQATARKQVVYEAFCQAIADGVQPASVPWQFSSTNGFGSGQLLRDARQQGYG